MLILLAVILAYLLGSLPMGYLVVRAATGQDVRQVGSGRTGGTNAMRAAGPLAGALTGTLDVLKGTAGVGLAGWLLAGQPEAQALGLALAGLAGILGHNYSLFLGFKGGAGAGPCFGAALGLWPASGFIVFPLGLAVFYFIGYACLTTLSVALTVTLLFTYRHLAAGAPVEYVYFGLGACALLLWAVRPNLRRLLRGEERVVGLRAKRLSQSR